jgi:hypothetical protein
LRYGLLGASDVPIAVTLLWVGVTFLALSSFGLWLLARGYRLRP